MRQMIVAVAMALSSNIALAQQATMDRDDPVRKCGGGFSRGFEADVKAEFSKFLSEAIAKGEAKIFEFAAVIDKMKPDEVGVKFYEVYTKCLKDQAEIELKKHDVKIIDKLSKLDEAVRAQPLAFPRGDFSANMFVRKIKAGREYTTLVKILDATCNINVWVPAWAFPPDQDAKPSLLIAMTNSGRRASSYPFEFHFDRDSEVTEDAEFATRHFPEVDQEKFGTYAKKADEIHVYLAFRAMGVNPGECSGSYLVDYIPKGERVFKDDKVEPAKLAGELYDKMKSAFDLVKHDLGEDAFKDPDWMTQSGERTTIGNIWGEYLGNIGYPRTQKARENAVKELETIGMDSTMAFLVRFTPANEEKIRYTLDGLKKLSSR